MLVTAADYASLNHDPAANVIDSEHTTPGQEPQVEYIYKKKC